MHECSIKHIEDVEYRGHEIVISQCKTCDNFIVDARSDNFDGPFLAGYIDHSIWTALEKARGSVDRHELDKALTVNIPF